VHQLHHQPQRHLFSDQGGTGHNNQLETTDEEPLTLWPSDEGEERALGSGHESLIPDSGGQIQALDRETCFDLLQTVGIGRVAWATESGRVLVLPVNFVVDEDAVVFKTAEGSKLEAVRGGRPLSFEADDVEPALHVGWSVLITGEAEVVTAADQLRRLAELPVAPWDATPKPFLVRLPAHEVTGRRLPLHPGGVTVVRQAPDSRGDPA